MLISGVSTWRKMKIPVTYHIYFWTINSMMALGTGFIMGIVTGRGIMVLFLHSSDDILMTISNVSVIAFSIGLLLIYQFCLASFIWGQRRGEFEYSYLETSVKKENPALRQLLKEAHQELMFADYASAESKMNKLVETYPDNFIVQFKYAVLCEGRGQAEVAISAYNKALALLPESSVALRVYVSAQISRTLTKGPSKWSASPGLKYVLY